MTILDIKNLSFSYGQNAEQNQILKDVNFKIEKNNITAIYGDSGSGKSTLLNILSLLHTELDSYTISGKIMFKGEDILSLTDDFWRIRRNIIYIAQTPNPFNFSIWKNMEFPLKINGEKDKKVIEEKIIKALKDVNLYEQVKDRLGKSANVLSGGQMQKLCFARALVLCPDILLMDEPTSSLDDKNKIIIEELIKKLGQKYAIVFVSHDPKQIKRIANNVLKCENKKIILS